MLYVLSLLCILVYALNFLLFLEKTCEKLLQGLVSKKMGMQREVLNFHFIPRAKIHMPQGTEE